MTISRVAIAKGPLIELASIGGRARSLFKWLLWIPADNELDAWRPHIDGLRAVSVLAVLFYHSGIFQVSGGFVGVDVFFVISGFLISKVIYGDVGFHGTFRIVRFYERRARRILPVFVVTTAATVIIGYFLFFPDEFSALGRSAIFACGFAANIFFYQTSGYFDGDAITKPLLHYWSLGVEEQFYIIFPLVVLAVFKFAPRWLGAAIILIGVLSFASAQMLLRSNPAAAFYLPTPRAWELMAGCLLALPRFPYSKQRIVCEVLAAVGLGLILFAAFTYSYATPFPGVTAAVPAAGAAFTLWACERSPTLVTLLLSTRPLRYIGLWSYSIYMIHWPMIVFARVIWPHGAPGLDYAIVAASIGLGCLSYFTVEMPFRAPKRLLSRPYLFGASGVALVMLASGGSIIAYKQGLPERLPGSVQRILAYDHYDYAPLFRQGTCFLGEANRVRDLSPECLSGRHPQALLWGDSTAAQYYEGLKKLFPQVTILQATMSSCPPIVGVINLPNLINCSKFNDMVVHWIVSSKPDLIIMSALWPEDSGSLSKLDATLKTISSAGIPVDIIGRGSDYADPVPDILARRTLRGDHNTRGGQDSTGSSFWGDYYMRARYSDWKGVRYISFQDAVCKESECSLVTESGVPVWWDNYHLTLEGAKSALKRMFPDGLLAKDGH